MSNTNSTKSPLKLNWSDRRTCLRVSVCLWGIRGVGVGRGELDVGVCEWEISLAVGSRCVGAHSPHDHFTSRNTMDVQ